MLFFLKFKTIFLIAKFLGEVHTVRLLFFKKFSINRNATNYVEMRSGKDFSNYFLIKK